MHELVNQDGAMKQFLDKFKIYFQTRWDVISSFICFNSIFRTYSLLKAPIGSDAYPISSIAPFKLSKVLYLL